MTPWLKIISYLLISDKLLNNSVNSPLMSDNSSH